MAVLKYACHCQERSGEAIQSAWVQGNLDCFAHARNDVINALATP